MKGHDEFLGPYDASKVAGVSTSTVRLWGDQGKLTVIRTAGGMRLFRRSEVEAIAHKRQARSTSSEGSAG
jgi:excisionase family DNA binding protein